MGARRVRPRSGRDTGWIRRPESCGVTVGEIEIAVIVHPAHVAQGFPSVAPGAGFRPDIAVTLAGAFRLANTHRNDVAAGRSTAVGIADLYLPGNRPAGQTALCEPRGAVDKGGHLALGPSVELEDGRWPQPVDPGLFEPLRARSCHVDDPHER